ncbi:protein kinase-1 [Chrysodeixis includens nucleopolyhedrovirus]|uniref:Protein kinase-1 n=1 Tax=Chrysodeixis includens nucleopolyhedrovirus TaxID=1207438 RepID=A0A5B8YTP5_9ABAC|nr:protein kinase-1 [Chrysodeixis includens nucleopolyhedrovirus]QED40531.1 protein kinase-1 [Chrysodeixis includens nucleopolyhedrovirus]
MDGTLREINDFYSEIVCEKNLSVNDGKFGKMSVWKHQTTQKLFLMKQISLKDFTAIEPMVHQLMKNNSFFVKIFYSFTTLKSHILIMDYIKGGDLFDLRRKHSKIPEEETKLIIGQLTEALMCLHKHRIIHNDVKLENVLYVRHKQIYLCDYGLCQIMGTPSCYEGTIDYFSPEKIKRKPYDDSFDWWAVGVIAYELLSGRHPFQTYYSDQDDYEFDLSVEDLHSKQLMKLNRILTASRSANHFIEQLLKYNINYRLKSGPEILKHDFFNKIQ